MVNTAIGGHAHVEESEAAFLANIGTLADAAQAAGLVVALEIHGDLMATGALSAALLDRIGHPAVKVNYDTANVEHYGGVRAEDDLPAIADRVANVHLKDMRGGKGDWDFPAIGEGHVDFGARGRDPGRRRLRRAVRRRGRVQRRAVAAAAPR